VGGTRSRGGSPGAATGGRGGAGAGDPASGSPEAPAGPAPPPWRADRELDAARVRAAVEEAFPDLAPARVRLLGSGWDNHAWVTDSCWVFRFARRREVAERLPAELALSRAAAEALAGTRVRVPRLERVAAPGRHFPYAFAGYRLVEGERADRVPPANVDREALAAELAAVLTRLHALPEARLGGARLMEPVRGPAAWRGAVMRRAETLRRVLSGRLRRACDPWLEGAVSPPAEHASAPRCVHNDLGPEHLLLDPACGRLVGILDFADAGFGDPSVDFVPFRWWAGPAPTEVLLRRYAPPAPDRGLRERVAFGARAASLVWLAEAATWGPEEDLPGHRARVEELFASGPA